MTSDGIRRDHLVNDGAEHTLDCAREAAGDRDVCIADATATIQGI